MDFSVNRTCCGKQDSSCSWIERKCTLQTCSNVEDALRQFVLFYKIRLLLMNMYDLVQHVFVRFKQRLSLGVVVGGASFVLFCTCMLLFNLHDRIGWLVIRCFYSSNMIPTFFEIWILALSGALHLFSWETEDSDGSLWVLQVIADEAEEKAELCRR